jgi:hypothetical protein
VVGIIRGMFSKEPAEQVPAAGQGETDREQSVKRSFRSFRPPRAASAPDPAARLKPVKPCNRLRAVASGNHIGNAEL